MKTMIAGSTFLALTAASVVAQLFQTDQRIWASDGNWPYSVRTNAPMGQTFTPSSNAVGFVQLRLYSGGPSVMHVNLRRGSMTGPVIARSRQVQVAAGFQVPIYFDFGTNVPVTAGTLHCIEPIIDSGNDCNLLIYHYSYPGGEAIVRGAPVSAVADMWFHEGTVANFPRFAAVSGGGQDSGYARRLVRADDGRRVFERWYQLAAIPDQSLYQQYFAPVLLQHSCTSEILSRVLPDTMNSPAPPNHALQRTRRERRGCNRAPSWAGSL